MPINFASVGLAGMRWDSASAISCASWADWARRIRLGVSCAKGLEGACDVEARGCVLSASSSVSG